MNRLEEIKAQFPPEYTGDPELSWDDFEWLCKQAEKIVFSEEVLECKKEIIKIVRVLEEENKRLTEDKNDLLKRLVSTSTALIELGEENIKLKAEYTSLLEDRNHLREHTQTMALRIAKLYRKLEEATDENHS